MAPEPHPFPTTREALARHTILLRGLKHYKSSRGLCEGEMTERGQSRCTKNASCETEELFPSRISVRRWLEDVEGASCLSFRDFSTAQVSLSFPPSHPIPDLCYSPPYQATPSTNSLHLEARHISFIMGIVDQVVGKEVAARPMPVVV